MLVFFIVAGFCCGLFVFVGWVYVVCFGFYVGLGVGVCGLRFYWFGLVVLGCVCLVWMGLVLDYFVLVFLLLFVFCCCFGFGLFGGNLIWWWVYLLVDLVFCCGCVG